VKLKAILLVVLAVAPAARAWPADPDGARFGAIWAEAGAALLTSATVLYGSLALGFALEDPGSGMPRGMGAVGFAALTTVTVYPVANAGAVSFAGLACQRRGRFLSALVGAAIPTVVVGGLYALSLGVGSGPLLLAVPVAVLGPPIGAVIGYSNSDDLWPDSREPWGPGLSERLELPSVGLVFEKETDGRRLQRLDFRLVGVRF